MKNERWFVVKKNNRKYSPRYQFTYIISMDGNNIEEMLNLDKAISGEFINNIFSREIHFSSKEIRGETYCGWTISKNEFDKLKEIISLYPSYKKFLELCYSK